jgi:hypothetical protein
MAISVRVTQAPIVRPLSGVPLIARSSGMRCSAITAAGVCCRRFMLG